MDSLSWYSKKIVIGESIRRRALQLLVPYFVWSIIQFALSGNYSLEYLGKMILYPDAFLWFLWVLFWICTLFTISQLIAQKCKINEMLTIGGTGVILVSLMVSVEIRMFGFQFIAYYYLFYFLGYCLHKFKESQYVKFVTNNRCLIILSLLWIVLAWEWKMHDLPSWFPTIPYVPTALLQYAYRGITALIAIVILIGASPKLLNNKRTINSCISKIGMLSLGIYTSHLAVLGYIRKIVTYTFPNNTCLSIVFTSLLALFTAYLIVILLETNKYTAHLFLGK